MSPLSKFAMNAVVEAAFDERVSFPAVITVMQDLARANWQDEAWPHYLFHLSLTN